MAATVSGGILWKLYSGGYINGKNALMIYDTVTNSREIPAISNSPSY